jgi:hypothetical protein
MLASCTHNASSTPSSAVPSTSSVAVTTTAPDTFDTSVPWVGPCGYPGPAPATYDHVIWIWMENKDLNAVLDSPKAQFIDSLGKSCGSALKYGDHGVHPSLPNYLAATSGGTQGVTDDAGPEAHPLTADNLFRQVRSAGKQARSYMEAMPVKCGQTSHGRYAVKHNPAAYYTGADDRTACQHDNVGFEQFVPDLLSTLPAFSFISPDLCNDMHDCPVSVGDGWLHTVVTSITSSAVYRKGHTAVFIVFDESSGGGTMPFVAITPYIAPGTRAQTDLDHYSLLAFTEDVLGISTHLGAAANAPSLAKAFGL